MRRALRSSGTSASRSAASSGDMSVSSSLALLSLSSCSSAVWYEGCNSSKVSAARSSPRASSTAARSSGESSCTRSAMSAGCNSSSLVRGTARRTELSSVCSMSTVRQSMRCGLGFWRPLASRSPTLARPTRRRMALSKDRPPRRAPTAPCAAAGCRSRGSPCDPRCRRVACRGRWRRAASHPGRSSRSASSAPGMRSIVPDSSKLATASQAA